MPNPFRVGTLFLYLFPGLSLRSNPGLKLANAFGVFFKLKPIRSGMPVPPMMCMLEFELGELSGTGGKNRRRCGNTRKPRDCNDQVLCRSLLRQLSHALRDRKSVV